MGLGAGGSSGEGHRPSWSAGRYRLVGHGWVRVALAHVVVAGVDGDGVVDDAVHDRVGGHVAAESLVPVLDGVLRAEHGAYGVVPVLHDLEKERAHAFVGLVEEPFVQHEHRVRAVFADELAYAGRLAGCGVELFRKVGHARVQGPVGLPARLPDNRAREPALARSGGPGRQDVEPLPDERTGLELVDGVAVELAFVYQVQGPQVGLRVSGFGAFGHGRDPPVGPGRVCVVHGKHDPLVGGHVRACLFVLAFEGVEEMVGSHQAQLASGLLVDDHRPAARP